MENIYHHYHKLRSKSLGLLVLRLVVGAIFVYSGWFKLMHMPMVTAGFATMHIPVFLAWAVALIEFIGGIAIIVGYFSKFFTFALFVIMVVAMILTKSFALNNPMGAELWLLLASLAAIFLAGCGRFSLCAWRHHKNCSDCKMDSKCNCEH